MELDTFQKQNLAKPTDKIHFKYLEHLSEPLSIVSEKQKEYVDNLLDHYDEILKITTTLFKVKN